MKTITEIVENVNGIISCVDRTAERMCKPFITLKKFLKSAFVFKECGLLSTKNIVAQNNIKELLEYKTVKELRVIAKTLGIVRISRKRKHIIIEEIIELSK